MDKLKDLLYSGSVPSEPIQTSATTARPHRCAKHVEDLMVAIMNFEVEDQMSIVWKCMQSEKGDEPARHIPAAARPGHNV
ncbi:hypothetical protein FBU30_007594 [Linnemannia zychae]|nr:hypothetical protein FBU30_007594 [Linnemannia zychae]